MLRLGFGLGAWRRAGGFGGGSFLLQPCEFSLGGIAGLESFVSFGTRSGRFRPGLHKLLEQVGTHAVKPGDLVLWRCDSA
ncbi:hypothetical protein KBI52_05900 [Microvirga sp. HBU67558]|uniref:hypothetical protein n=1 Tax=Microvirga sp. HBU67558 TaxID=2824562 RepID=UPI001B398567|nr:hypothetical protein [Microvirga sp. HBU67558]MBQ0819751.1 hypothetical protein [Microvirga sp. HBU67558]